MGITTAVVFYNTDERGRWEWGVGWGSRQIVVTRLGAGRPREIVIRIPKFSEDFSPPKRPDRQWDPSNLLFNGDFFTAVEQPQPKANHSDPSSLKLNNKWSYTSTRSNAFEACTGTTLPSRVTTLEVLRREPQMSCIYLLNIFAI